MAKIELIKGGRKPEGELERLQRVGTGAGISALQGLENLFGLIPAGLSALGVQPIGTHGEPLERTSEQLMQQYNLTPEYLAPRNLPESIGYKLAGKALPSAALGGIPGLAVSGLESLVGGGLQQAGAPQGLQDVAELATGITAAIRGVPGVPKGRIKTPAMAQRVAHEGTVAAVPKGTLASANPVVSALRTVEEKLGTEVSEKVANKVRHALKVTEENLFKGKLNPEKAIELRKNLYHLGDELSQGKAAEYISPLTQNINQFFAEYGATNPKFYELLKSRDKLTELRNMRSYLEVFADKFGATKLPYVGKTISSIIGNTVGTGDKFIRAIATNPEARKYYFNTVKAAFEQSPEIFSRNLVDMSNVLQKNEKGKIRLLKGGLKAQ